MLFLALFLSYLGTAEPVPANSVSDDQVRAAIAAAVRQRMGSDIDVAVDNLVVQIAPGSAVLEAVPEPTARLEGTIRFILRWAGTERSGARVIRAGAATAKIRVTLAHAHTATLILRGADVTQDEVLAARHEIAAGPLRPWPTVADVVGGKVIRDLAPDACIARGAIVDRPDVRSGDDVLAFSTITGVVASAQMVAAESGDTGSVIRVVNQQSRRALKARIVSAGLVEILK